MVSMKFPIFFLIFSVECTHGHKLIWINETVSNSVTGPFTDLQTVGCKAKTFPFHFVHACVNHYNNCESFLNQNQITT